MSGWCVGRSIHFLNVLHLFGFVADLSLVPSGSALVCTLLVVLFYSGSSGSLVILLGWVLRLPYLFLETMYLLAV